MWLHALEIYELGALFSFRGALRYLNSELDDGYKHDDDMNFAIFCFALGITAAGTAVLWPLVPGRVLLRRFNGGDIHWQRTLNRIAGDKKAIAIENERKISQLEQEAL